LQVLQKNRAHQFIHQNPAVLRIVLKLDDVKAAVTGLDQVRLGAAAHSPDVPARRDRHWK